MRSIMSTRLFNVQKIIALIIGLLIAGPTSATVISNSGVEVEYTYTTEFRTMVPATEMHKVNALKLANMHAEHIFGVFQSTDFAEKNGFPAELTEGWAGSKHSNVTRAVKFKKSGDDNLWIDYTVKTNAIILNKVAEKIFSHNTEATIPLPLLLDLPRVYTPDMMGYQSDDFKRCTDPHYETPDNFYYFYNPFRCPELGKNPIGQMVDVTFKKIKNSDNAQKKLPLEKLRADNKNGRLFVFYFTYGYAEYLSSPEDIKRDAGWRLFNSLSKTLTNKYKFTEVESTAQLREALGKEMRHLKLYTLPSLNHPLQKRFLRTHVLRGDDVTIVVRSGLFPTDNEKLADPLITFPKFWKEAWENGDFIYYGGHSDDGRSLLVDTMLANLGTVDIKEIHFNNAKEQIAFFDSCSSYAHFVKMYADRKPQNLSVISYGLVSLFHLADSTVQSLLEVLITGDSQNTLWQDTLQKIEKESLYPHVKYMYDRRDFDEVYKDFSSKGLYPSYLLNVTTDI